MNKSFLPVRTLKYCYVCEKDTCMELVGITIGKCYLCKEFKPKCFKYQCQRKTEFNTIICDLCYAVSTPSNVENKTYQSDSYIKSRSPHESSLKVFIIVGIVLAFLSYGLVKLYSKDKNVNDIKSVINKFKDKYPLQKNETWYEIYAAVETEPPSVKSIILLHGEDLKTSNCLVKDLVTLFSKSRTTVNDRIKFSKHKYKNKDYGFVLEYYLNIVKESRILITQLEEVNGNMARIFQSLCDEFAFDVKPSLFIFSLKYSSDLKELKPSKRAITILQQLWNELPSNELDPLLSRVVKNVIDVVPETNLSC